LNFKNRKKAAKRKRNSSTADCDEILRGDGSVEVHVVKQAGKQATH
jgi:hypothetical protein